MVDLTVVGLGRYIPRIERIAAETPVNIIVATGLYIMEAVPFYFYHRGPGTALGGPELMTDMFVADIETGIGTTNVRAGILKCATDEAGLTKDVDRVLRAVAQAHRQTGVPISTHTNGLHGDDQQRVFSEEGVDLERVIIGHCGDSTDLNYLAALMDNGSYIGMDHFGVEMMPFETRVETVVTLCKRGYANKMVLSHDAVCHTDAWDLTLVDWPNWRYAHIPEDVLPALTKRGVSEEDIHRMMVENPRRIFEAQGGY
jgi:phosphotriesterase-related protein